MRWWQAIGVSARVAPAPRWFRFGTRARSYRGLGQPILPVRSLSIRRQSLGLGELSRRRQRCVKGGFTTVLRTAFATAFAANAAGGRRTSPPLRGSPGSNPSRALLVRKVTPGAIPRRSSTWLRGRDLNPRPLGYEDESIVYRKQ